MKPLRAKVSHPAEGTSVVEIGIDYTDGVRVAVDWDDDEQEWCAQIDGPPTGPLHIGYGHTIETALCDLVCSLAATLAAFHDDIGEGDGIS